MRPGIFADAKSGLPIPRAAIGIGRQVRRLACSHPNRPPLPTSLTSAQQCVSCRNCCPLCNARLCSVRTPQYSLSKAPQVTSQHRLFSQATPIAVQTPSLSATTYCLRALLQLNSKGVIDSHDVSFIGGITLCVIGVDPDTPHDRQKG